MGTDAKLVEILSEMRNSNKIFGENLRTLNDLHLDTNRTVHKTDTRMDVQLKILYILVIIVGVVAVGKEVMSVFIGGLP